MIRDDLLLRAKLTPPRSHRRTLARPGVGARLGEALDHRLTIVQAGTGYGKTTALAAFCQAQAESPAGAGLPALVFWYALDDSDRDPQQFLAYLIGAFRQGLPHLDETPAALLAEPGRWLLALDALINALADQLTGPALLVLDDYHFVSDALEVHDLVERLVTFLPPDLHVILTTRRPVTFAALPAWRARGEILELSRADLAFGPAEVDALFREIYAAPLSPADVAALADRTEGWPIALQLAWQSLRSGAARDVGALLAGGSQSTSALFDYLAHELLDRQPPEVAAFLLETAVLRALTPEACAAVCDQLPEPQPSGIEALAGLSQRESDRLKPLFQHDRAGGADASLPLVAQHDKARSGLAAGAHPSAGDDSLSMLARRPAQDASALEGDASLPLVAQHDRAGDHVRRVAALLARVHQLDLFTVALGDGHYRYHHLFHEFLNARAQALPEACQERHRRAAAYFQALGNDEEAIYHWLAAGLWNEAAEALAHAGEPALRTGRLALVSGWLDALPADVVAEQPRLQALLGDICRLRNRFDEALAWYKQAESIWRARGDVAGLSRALHGQASVYLDTVRPAQAETLLQEALRLAEGIDDRAGRARLLELLAENKLNLGKPAEAEALRSQAQALRDAGPTEDALSLRVKLRTGQHTEARRILEAQVEAERRAARSGQVGPPRAHRESMLLLSLIDAFQGRAESAFALAREGIALGEQLGAPFVVAVGHMRLGHAWQLAAPRPPLLALATVPEDARHPEATAARNEAIRCYETAIALGDRLDVRRTRAEALWGLTRAYGFFPVAEGDPAGDLASAERAAREGVEIAHGAGDAWVAALTELTLGASYVLAGQPERGQETLARVLVAFRDCGDTFGRAATRLWQGLAQQQLRQGQHLAAALEDLLALCEANGYDYLLVAPTLHGPPDPRRIIPLLLEARNRRIRPAYVARLLALAGLPDILAHPGYQLRVQTLGAFRVWRGEFELAPREWQRDKARQLFQLFITERGRWLQRDEIVDRLWPSLGPEAAARDFKVALNALNRAAEPGHQPDEPFAFIAREGAAYRLRPEADLWLDAAAFERRCEAGLRGPLTGPGSAETLAHLRAALRLYAGDYLPDALYDDWSAEARERLLTLYLRAADRLAAVLIQRQQYDEALDACQAILARDPCWESAYRTMMQAYARQGNRAQACRAYQRCVETLRQQLDVAPSPETVAFYQGINC